MCDQLLYISVNVWFKKYIWNQYLMRDIFVCYLWFFYAYWMFIVEQFLHHNLYIFTYVDFLSLLLCKSKFNVRLLSNTHIKIRTFWLTHVLHFIFNVFSVIVLNQSIICTFNMATRAAIFFLFLASWVLSARNYQQEIFCQKWSD